jgi:hypothetical protein
MINVLELFSGTKSVGKVCDSLGWNSVSVDLLLPADHEVDILQFDYKQYPKDYFDIVWASPPCTEYSNLQNCWIGRKKKDGITFTKEIIEEKMNESDKLILKTLEIIEYFNPVLWFMENPQTGKLKNREVVKGLPFYDIDYCMYSDWGYKKRTRIWTNKKDWDNKLCDGSGSCGNMVDNQSKHKLNVSKDVHTVGERKKKYTQHKTTADGGYDKRRKYPIHNGTTKMDRYRIPEDLIYSLFLD